MGSALLLLDVDGVVSPIGVTDTWDDLRTVGDAPYWLQVSPTMGRRLAALPADRRWLTSWDDLANDWVAPALGWDPLPVVNWPHGPGPRPNVYKADGLARLLDELGARDERPAAVVWCEDTVVEGSELRSRGEALLVDIPHLIVVPDPAVGLTPGDIDRIGEFLADSGA